MIIFYLNENCVRFFGNIYINRPYEISWSHNLQNPEVKINRFGILLLLIFRMLPDTTKF